MTDEAPRRTLYVSDLDGTLLRPDATLGERTVSVVNRFVAAGGLFTYATARSFARSSVVTRGLDLQLPVITYGGAVIVDADGNARPAALIPDATVRAVHEATADSDSVQPLEFAMHNGRDRVCWLAQRRSKPIDSFLAQRRDDPRLLPLQSWEEIDLSQIFLISFIGERAAILGLREQLRTHLDGCDVVFSADVYDSDEYWLEITSVAGTKAAAVQKLRAELGVDEVVCFGDNHNDLSMFATADTAVAVANAAQAVREAATYVIGSNAVEAVAQWLAERRCGVSGK